MRSPRCAADDLTKVTDNVRATATRCGMVAKLGHVGCERDPPTPLVPGATAAAGPRSESEETAREIDHVTRGLIDAAFATASVVLRSHRDTLDDGARQLLERETLVEADLAAHAPQRNPAT